MALGAKTQAASTAIDRFTGGLLAGRRLRMEREEAAERRADRQAARDDRAFSRQMRQAEFEQSQQLMPLRLEQAKIGVDQGRLGIAQTRLGVEEGIIDLKGKRRREASAPEREALEMDAARLRQRYDESRLAQQKREVDKMSKEETQARIDGGASAVIRQSSDYLAMEPGTPMAVDGTISGEDIKLAVFGKDGYSEVRRGDGDTVVAKDPKGKEVSMPLTEFVRKARGNASRKFLAGFQKVTEERAEGARKAGLEEREMKVKEADLRLREQTAYKGKALTPTEQRSMEEDVALLIGDLTKETTPAEARKRIVRDIVRKSNRLGRREAEVLEEVRGRLASADSAVIRERGNILSMVNQTFKQEAEAAKKPTRSQTGITTYVPGPRAGGLSVEQIMKRYRKANPAATDEQLRTAAVKNKQLQEHR